MAAGTLFTQLLVATGAMSVDLSGASFPVPSSPAFAFSSGTTTGTRGALANPASTSSAKVGVAAPVHDLVVFEHIHVLPRAKDLPALISEQVFEIEVWNAYRGASKILTAITVTGTAGLVVDNPDALPTHYPPLHSKVYTVHALTEGDATIDNVATWTFTGIPTAGTTLIVTGLRVVPWPFRWDASEDLVERYGYLTDILDAEDGTEQRVQLASVPRWEIEFGVLLSGARDAQLANALLYGRQSQPYGVPLWQYATRLATPVTLNDTTITFDTTDIPYEVDGVVFLWRDPYTWEALTIQSIAAGSIVTTTPARATWPIGVSLVMPLGIGRLSPREGFTWEDLRVGSVRLPFSLEPVRE